MENEKIKNSDTKNNNYKKPNVKDTEYFHILSPKDI